MIDVKSIDDISLILAAKFGHKDVVKVLIDGGFDPNIQDAKFGVSSLHVASYYGYLDVAKELLDNGAESSIKNHRRATPLHYAAFDGHTDLVYLLINRGARTNMTGTNFGLTPLQISALVGLKDTVRIL